MPDTPPPPSNREPWRPFIIDQRADGDRGVLVTWSLPGLARATVRVPADSWVQGEHLSLGHALAAAAQIPPVVGGGPPQGDGDVEYDDAADDVTDY